MRDAGLEEHIAIESREDVDAGRGYQAMGNAIDPWLFGSRWTSVRIDKAPQRGLASLPSGQRS